MNRENTEKIRSILNQIGKGFCLAKWYELDLDLSSGRNRSCDLVDYHSVPIDDLRIDNSLFHNSNFKKVQRRFMLIDIQPKECSICWRYETTGKAISPRLEKSSVYHPDADIEKIITVGDTDNFFPKKIKITFSRACNIKRINDNPRNNSEWLRDIQINGPYAIDNKSYHSLDFLKYSLIYNDQKDNPYIEIFWSWFYEASNEVNYITLQGGEPLMDRNFFRMMNFYNLVKNKNLVIEILSYCDPAGDRWQGFIHYVKKISKKIKEIKLVCKVDTWGRQLEYCNYGVNLERLEKNLKDFLNCSRKNNSLVFQIDFHMLSYFSLIELMKFILQLRKKFLNKNRKVIFFTIDIVSEPIFLHPSISKELIFHIDNVLNFMKSNVETRGNKHIGFNSQEVQMIENVKNGILNTDIDSMKDSFLQFVDQYDSRTNQNFNDFFKDYK